LNPHEKKNIAGSKLREPFAIAAESLLLLLPFLAPKDAHESHGHLGISIW
jgi:hypothetical protein